VVGDAVAHPAIVTLAIDDAARQAGRDPARIRRLADVNCAISDGADDGWLEGPVEHWVEELVR
jgi:hypothetical protein